MSRYRATSTGAPNFAYEMCAREQTVAACQGLDLSAWTIASCGAEMVRAGTLAKFAKAYAPVGFRQEAFYPCYGLAEATLMVTGGNKSILPITQTFDREAINRGRAQLAENNAPGSIELVGCGHEWGIERITLVDPVTEEKCSPGQIGEIWVKSDTISNTYWGNVDESERIFRARTATGEGPFLRTGDLGLLHQGELFVTGRSKDLIVIRGVNHFAHDIEYVLRQCHPGLQGTSNAAFTVDDGEDERLVIVQELPRGKFRASTETLRDAINATLSEEFGIAANVLILTAPGTIPRTSSGKTMRYACRQHFLEGNFAAIEDRAVDSDQIQ